MLIANTESHPIVKPLSTYSVKLYYTAVIFRFIDIIRYYGWTIGSAVKRRLLSTVRFALGVAVSAVLTWAVVRGLDWGTVGASLEGISPSLLFLSLIIFLSASCLRAVRWHFLFLNGEVSTQRLFVVQNVELGLNNIVPFRCAASSSQRRYQPGPVRLGQLTSPSSTWRGILAWNGKPASGLRWLPTPSFSCRRLSLPRSFSRTKASYVLEDCEG